MRVRLSSTSTVSSCPLTTSTSGSSMPRSRPDALEQAAGQREDARPPRDRLVPRGGRGRRRVHTARREQAVRLRQREYLVDHARQHFVARLGLLGHAGADEHAAHVLSVELLDGVGRGDHRRDHGDEAVDQFGHVLAHVLRDGGAGGGDVHARRGRLQVAGVRRADQVGALRHFHHVGEPGRLEGADHLPGGLGEARRERRRQQGGDRMVLVQQLQRPLQPAQVRLGVLRAAPACSCRRRYTATRPRRPARPRCGSPRPGSRARTCSSAGSSA